VIPQGKFESAIARNPVIVQREAPQSLRDLVEAKLDSNPAGGAVEGADVHSGWLIAGLAFGTF
jgi:hypothetical protein